MTRTDIHLDAKLRHLGAAYYDSLQGKAARPMCYRRSRRSRSRLKAQQRQAPGGATASVGIRRVRAGRRSVARGAGISPGSGT